MEWIGKRVKSRSRQRLQVVNKRKKMEVEAPVISPPKKRRPRRRKDPDSDVEDITPTYQNLVPPPVQENDRYSAGLRAGSVQNNSVKESFSRIIRDLNMEKSGPSSYSKFRDGSEQHTSVKETSFRGSDLDVGKNSVPSSFGFRDVSEQNTCVKEKCSPEIGDLNVEKSGPSSSKLRDLSEPNTCVKEKCFPEIGDMDVEKSGPSSPKLRDVSEQNTCVKEKCSPEIRDFDVEKSGPSSSKLRDVSEQNTCVEEKCSPEIRVLDVEKPGTSSSKLRDVSEQHTCVNEKFSPEITNLDVGISVPSSSKLREVSEQNIRVTDMCSPETRGLVVVKPVPGEIEILSDSESEIGARASAKKKLFEDTSRIVESLSDGNSTSETEGDEEENAESADNNTKDDITVHSLSSEDPSSSSSSSAASSSLSSSSSSSSSSDGEFNLKEVVRDNTDDDDFLKVSLPVRNVSIAERKPLVRYKRSGSCLTNPRKEDKKIRRLNHREEEKEEERDKVVEIVIKQPSNPVFTCTHCGKENTGVPESHSSFMRPLALRDEIEDVNNFASTIASKYEDSISFNSGKSPQKLSRLELENPETGKEVKTLENPSTSRPEVFASEKAKEVQAPERPSTYRHEILSSVKAKEVQALEKPSRPDFQNSEKAKEVQAINRLGSVIPAVAVVGGLNKSLSANEPIDNQSDSSISSADKSGYESDPSLKDKEIKTNNNSDWRVLNGNHREVDLFRLLVNSVRDKGQLDEGYEEAEELVSSPEDQSQEQGEDDQRKYDDDGLLIIRPPPLIERFGMLEPPSPPEISESE
ncbi:PREDICTED: SNF2 domain-containing protein CLASSY 3-like isoform X2 [Camelina sativa]|uniref:SNF2 domain-containing protein CLASSY 3-like isoform X2 n=1 Tax=Camelina sativa TaxID=90675 RepID=A0ABM1QVX5_CAMSA|nr:PREDICTED: SNF2 domain-containing protein CLASSY 3-like isoform X2 [Camelina sativa]